MRALRLVVLAGLVVSSSARAELPFTQRWGEGLAWVPHAVRAPVAPEAVTGALPYLPREVPEVSGEVEVGPQAGAAFWLSPLEVVQISAGSSELRFQRVVGERGAQPSWLRLEDPGIPARAGHWYLAEPIGEGSVWIVTAPAPTRIRVHRPVASADTLGSEALRHQLVAWLNGEGALPPMPLHGPLRDRLQLEAELGETLTRGLDAADPLHGAVRSWRLASALQALSVALPFSSSLARIAHPALPGEQQELEGFGAPFFRAGGTGEVTLELEGPGVAELEARALLTERVGAPVSVAVSRAEVLLGQAEAPPLPAMLGEEPAVPLPTERIPRRLDTGEVVGREGTLRVALLPGTHPYTVRWSGGPSLLRLTHARRRGFVGEKLAGVPDWDGAAQRAFEALAQDPRPQASVVRARLRALHPGLPAAAVAGAPSIDTGALAPEVRALFALEQAAAISHSGQRKALATEARTALGAPWAQPRSALAWSVRLRTAKLLVELGEAATARELLRSAPDFPPTASLACEAAELLPSLPQGAPLRSRELAALELAWRKDPLNEDVRRRYRAAWGGASRWLQLRPLTVDDRPKPIARRWLDREANDALAFADAPGAMWAVAPGQSLRVRAEALGDETWVLRSFVTGDAAATLHVGALALPLPTLAGVETAEVALPPGEHEVRLTGAPGVRAWVPATLGGAQSSEVAWLRTQWPVRSSGRPVHFAVPDSQLPSPVRVQLRAEGADRPLALWMRTDLGPPFRLTLTPGRPSADHLSVDGVRGQASAAASAVVLLPPFTREVWFEADEEDAEVFVSLAVRRSEEEPPAPRTAPAVASEGPEAPRELSARLLQISRRLSDEGETDDLLLTRASLLLDASEEGLAREDLVRVLARQGRLSGPDTQRLETLLARLDAAFPDHVRFRQPITGPVAISPAYGALGAASADPAEVARRYAEARARIGRGELEQGTLELVRVYRDTQSPQVALEAVRALAALQTSTRAWRQWGAPMALALVADLDRWADTPDLRRLRKEASRWARWQGLRDPERQVGTIELLTETAGDDEEARVRKALLAAPWPLEEVHSLTGGRTQVVDVRFGEPRKVTAHAMCATLRGSRRLPGKPCRFELRVDGMVTTSRRAAVGDTVKLSAELSAGRHQVELHLEDDDAPILGAVRFTSAAEGAAPERLSLPTPLPSLRTRPGEPVVFTALGPAALRIHARAVGPELGRELQVRDGDRAAVVMALPADADTEVTGASGTVGREADTILLLPEPGPHRVSFESATGEALVRVQLGDTRRPGDAEPEWWARSPTALEPLPWPTLPERFTLLPGAVGPGTMPRGLGTITAQLGLVGEDFEEGDLQHAPRSLFDGRLAYRHELRPEQLWLLVESRTRLPLDMSPVLGGRAAVHARRLPLGLRGTVEGSFATQQVLTDRRFSVRARVSTDRYFGLGPDLGLIPGFGATWELMQPGTAAHEAIFDQSVYWRYGEQHPLRLSPRASLRWQPFADDVGTLTAFATTNAEILTLDHATLRAQWETLLRVVPGARLNLAYDASYRFADLHRSQPYLRHGLKAGADIGVWQGHTGRLLLFAEDRAFISGPFGLQNLISVGVRYDWTGGRGLRDVMPFEEEFEDLLDPSQHAR